MLPLGLCSLELRNIMEHAFLPLQCTCTVQPDQSMTLDIKDPQTGRSLLTVADISVTRLNSSRDISSLITELRLELAYPQPALPHARAS